MYTESSDLFFNDVNLPALTHEQKEYCDQEIIESEIMVLMVSLLTSINSSGLI